MVMDEVKNFINKDISNFLKIRLINKKNYFIKP